MHERFSDRARHAMALANHEAGRLNHPYIAPAHIMLGIIAEGACVATEALRVLDVDLDAVREQVASKLDKGNAAPTVGRRAQSDGTKQVIATAIQEARKFGHRYVGTEHLTLGLLAYEDGIPSQVLRNQGLAIEKLREQVLAMLRSSVDASHDLAHSRHGDYEWMHQQELAKAFSSPSFWHIMVLAVDSANRLGSGPVNSEHLLLALARDSDSPAAQILADKGITADWLREQLIARSV